MTTKQKFKSDAFAAIHASAAASQKVGAIDQNQVWIDFLTIRGAGHLEVYRSQGRVAELQRSKVNSRPITASNRLPTASSRRDRAGLRCWVKKSTMMLARRHWHQGRPSEIATAINIWVISTSPGTGLDHRARAATLHTTIIAHSMATSAPSQAQATASRRSNWLMGRPASGPER